MREREGGREREGERENERVCGGVCVYVRLVRVELGFQ